VASSRHDLELVRAVGRGDGTALEALFRRHHTNVYALCVRLLDSPDAAEDAVQETFLRVLRSAARFEGRARVSTWIYRVARNTCLDLLAARSRSSRRDAAWARETAERRSSESGADARQSLLEAAFDRLPRDARAVLVLARHLDLPYDDVGRVLGCSAGAARVRVHRALRKLRDLYLDMERDECGANGPNAP
jgi:RNA polymerase sigma-70 factor (ECF subfamily)